MKKDLDLTSYEKLVLEEYIDSLPKCEREGVQVTELIALLKTKKCEIARQNR